MRRQLLAAVLAALFFAPAGGAWTWPAGGAVLQPFVFDPAHPYAAGQHRGVDIGGDPGATVLAPAAGTATYAGTVPSSGKSLTITTAGGYAVTLTHLGSITVARGAAIAEGAAVGTIGPSGDPEVPQPYVHLGVRTAAEAQGYLDPLTFLPARVPAPTALVPPPVAVPSPAPLPSVAEPAPAPVLAPAPVAVDPAPLPAPARVVEPAPVPALVVEPAPVPAPVTAPVPVLVPSAEPAPAAAAPQAPEAPAPVVAPAPVPASEPAAGPAAAASPQPVLEPAAPATPVEPAGTVPPPAAVAEPAPVSVPAVVAATPVPVPPAPVTAAGTPPAPPVAEPPVPVPEPAAVPDPAPPAVVPPVTIDGPDTPVTPPATAGGEEDDQPLHGGVRGPALRTVATAAPTHDAPATDDAPRHGGWSAAAVPARHGARQTAGIAQLPAADARGRTRAQRTAHAHAGTRKVAAPGVMPTATVLRGEPPRGEMSVQSVAAVALLAATVLAGLLGAVRMMVRCGTDSEEDPGRPGVAVCGGAPSPRPCGGLRRPVGRVRPLSPAEGERRPHGERHGRARHAGDGGRRQGGQVLR
jgi:hypothetical protein